MPRPSPVRDALERVFAGHDHRTWSLEELVDRVRETVGGGDFSTVFRAVGVLEKKGQIQRVDLGDGLSRYEARRDHHEHVRCDSCGRVAEVQGCAVAGAAREIERVTGYLLTSHSLVFSGLCPDCAAHPA
jgi:Fe2+ or Zn2+ uptake regulation protein